MTRHVRANALSIAEQAGHTALAAEQFPVAGNVFLSMTILPQSLKFDLLDLDLRCNTSFCILIVMSPLRSLFGKNKVSKNDQPAPAAPSRHESSSVSRSKEVFPTGLKCLFEPESAIVE